MPELPEIIAHAERLGRAFAGAELAGFAPLHPTALKTFDPRPDSAAGRQLTGAGHRGKYLCLHFGDLIFVVHLMQGGRLRPHDPPASAPAKSMTAVIAKGLAHERTRPEMGTGPATSTTASALHNLRRRGALGGLPPLRGGLSPLIPSGPAVKADFL